jgi:sarcosine oxidase
VTRTVDHVVVGLGGLGSATLHELASRGRSVVGVEQFELGHTRGASHDTSRILRRSYHTPGYVRLACEAYDDWARLSPRAGRELVTTTGGVDLFPPGAAIAESDYSASLAACGVPFEQLSPANVAERWPVISLLEGGVALYQADTGIVHAAETVALLHRLARDAGAEVVERTPARVLSASTSGVLVDVGGEQISCGSVVVCADAWTNSVLADLGVKLPLTVTQEQVTYFAPADPAAYAVGHFPVWIWMDDPSFYGFPVFGERGVVKAGQDVGGRETTGDGRDFAVDPHNQAQLTAYMQCTFTGSATRVVRTVTCLYTLTPDRDFVVSALPAYPNVVVGLGAGHGFKFVPTFGRMLADLATEGATSSDVSAFSADRQALTAADAPKQWLV